MRFGAQANLREVSPGMGRLEPYGGPRYPRQRAGEWAEGWGRGRGRGRGGGQEGEEMEGRVLRLAALLRT